MAEEPKENPRRYKWPWFVLAAVVLFFALAVFWMTIAVKKEEQQRDYNAPVPGSSK